MAATNRKLRIVSDGTPFNTKVFLGEQDITDQVISVSWSLGAGEVAKATISMYLAEADVQADLNETVSNVTKKT
jgi:hypothetical protein